MDKDQEQKLNPEEVDLKYVLTVDKAELRLIVKFTGFENEEQIVQFGDFLEESLPLLFFDSNVKH